MAMTEKQKMDALDRECNELFRKLDALKAEGKNGSNEYMQTLYTLRDKTRERLQRIYILGREE